MDPHISVIADFKTVCPDIEVTDWCLSGHAWVMKRPQDRPDHINSSTWMYLNEDMIRAFQERYDSFLRTFDMFIVCHAATFALIYEKYDKPIVMINSCRYDIPFCWTRDTHMLSTWKNCIQRLHGKGRLTMVSNNKADQLYTKLGCGIEPRYIPSLCAYTKAVYTPTKPTFLCYNGTVPDHPLLTHKKDLPQRHEWSDVTSFRGVVHFPYEVSMMSVFEQFTAGCPLFFPSKAYWKAHPTIQSVSAYWGPHLPGDFAALSTSDAWIELADMYGIFQSPNTHYFDSTEDLLHLIETFEYTDDRELRRAHVQHINQEWSRVIDDIKSHMFRTKHPRHMCYNRLPLLANIVYDANYTNSGVQVQHSYPYREDFIRGDVVFVKTDFLAWFLRNRTISVPITLVTGVSDMSPSQEDCITILSNPHIRTWIGCNIPVQHPKIVKVPIGVGEPERVNGNHETLVGLHASRIPWNEKKDDACVPYHGETHRTRTRSSTLPKLGFEDYMRAIGQHKFVVCQRGNGLDTHRVCEVLLMGSVPVVEHSGLDDMYEQWPVCIVDSLDTIDTTSFVFDEEKYQAFLDVFWIRTCPRMIYENHID
jgi:hypothetical protein